MNHTSQLEPFIYFSGSGSGSGSGFRIPVPVPDPDFWVFHTPQHGCQISKKYMVNQDSMSNTASHDNHEKINLRVFFSLILVSNLVRFPIKEN